MLVSLIGLALAGLTLAVLFFFEPCEKETVYATVRAPFDVVQAADASGSIYGWQWTQEQAAARALLEVFYAETHACAAAWVSWSSSSSVAAPLTTIPDAAWIHGLDMGAQENGLTSYGQALLRCADQFATRGRADAFQVCEIITDGEYTDRDYVYDGSGDADENAVYALCQTYGVASCTIYALADHMKDTLHVSIQNVMVGSHFSAEAEADALRTSSCDDTADDCPWIVGPVDDFGALARPRRPPPPLARAKTLARRRPRPRPSRALWPRR